MCKTRRLTHVYLFGEKTMQKRILNVNLSHRPASRIGHGKNSPDGGWLDNRAECFPIIESSLLMKAFGNETSLVAFNSAISLSFKFEYPFTSHNISRSKGRDKGPCLILEKSIKFLMHSSTPFWAFTGSSETGGFNHGWCSHREQGSR